MSRKQHILVCCFLFTHIHIFAQPTCSFVDSKEKILICTQSGASDIVLKRGLVSDNKNTEAITLSGCKITSLDSDSLESLSSIRYLDLSDNKLEKLEDGVFDACSTLISLNVSNNLLNEYPIDLLMQTPDLSILDVRQNRLEYLKLGIFDYLEKLTTLDLSWNHLLGRDLNPILFENNRHITYINFSGNDMNDAPENLLQPIKSLETLDLGGCALHEIPAFVIKSNLKTVKELILSSNEISELNNDNVFVHLESLQTLKLSENDLEYVEELVFKPLIHLKVIELQNNKLTHLSDNIFQNLNSLENIDLSHNMITKVSLNAFLQTPVRVLNLSYNRITYLEKDFCSELRKAGGNLTEFHFHQNPWQCACLADIINEVEDFHLIYTTDIPGFKKPVCVTANYLKCKRDDTFNGVFKNIYDKIKLIGTKPS